MKIELFGRADENTLALFLAGLGFCLPKSYLDFLRDCNGGLFDAIVSCEAGEIIVDCLFGLDLDKNLDISIWRAEFEGEIPKESLIIGCDPGGGFFLLIVEPKNAGVYFYDHAYTFPSSSDEKNTYLVDSDVAEFLDKCFWRNKDQKT